MAIFARPRPFGISTGSLRNGPDSIGGRSLRGPSPSCPYSAALAHGLAAERFFPATILTDDPFVADQISLPQVTVNPPAADGSQLTGIQIDLSKRITPNIGVTFGDQWQYLQPPNLPRITVAAAMWVTLTEGCAEPKSARLA